jgi:hypothetical protein
LDFERCRTLAAGEGAGFDAASLQLPLRTLASVRVPGAWPSKTHSARVDKNL